MKLFFGLASIVLALSSATIPVGYAGRREQTRTRGRVMAALIRTGDAHELAARFNSHMAEATPEANVRQMLQETLVGGGIGEPLGEKIIFQGPQETYVGDYRYRTGYIETTFVFTADGKITGMALQPRAALPPDPKAGYATKARLRLPFAGVWWVSQGGPTEAQNHHSAAPDQRHAYDLVIWQGGDTHQGDGARNEDYWAWGQPILAPAAATVVEAQDGIADNAPQKQTNLVHPFGNHVVLDLGHSEFAVLAHLQKGSVQVRPGEKVRLGQRLGLCGNSGNSSEPHLHFHLQDRALLLNEALGLPLAFTDYIADGQPVSRGTPVQGQFLSGSSIAQGESNPSQLSQLSLRQGSRTKDAKRDLADNGSSALPVARRWRNRSE